MKLSKKILLLIFAISVSVFIFSFKNYTKNKNEEAPLWNFMSIDTMKYSRDLAREKMESKSFEKVIDSQVKAIAKTGATHIAIATPYDDEFLPMLKKWVNSARKYHLKVWFRGNFSGWEGWFEYQKIDRPTHMQKTKDFISKNSGLFEDGDVFTPCPECENGGPGDPRMTGDVEGFRKFMIDEYSVTKEEFNKINKKVSSNFNSMNGDVASAVMDKPTTKAMDGIVTIDHYVSTPMKLIEKINQLSNATGGKIVLGEFGAPIPDINGDMSEDQQSEWISKALGLLSTNSNLVGLNYWTNQGSTTALWNDDGSEKKAVKAITNYYGVKIANPSSENNK